MLTLVEPTISDSHLTNFFLVHETKIMRPQLVKKFNTEKLHVLITCGRFLWKIPYFPASLQFNIIPFRKKCKFSVGTQSEIGRVIH